MPLYLSMYKLKISAIIPQPNDNLTIEFEDVNQNFPAYLAGQFLSLVFHFGEREVRRSYSFNSSPDVEEPLSITVKRVENGEISRHLHHQLAVGDLVDAMDPQGIFTYQPQMNREQTVFLFAAGIGITPLFSILKTALVAENSSKIVLVYSNSSPEKTPFQKELLAWEAQYPDRLTIIWAFSNNKNLLRARLNRDFIFDILKKHLPEDQSKAIFYTCGPVIYMDLCKFTLLGMGFSIEQIKRETFLLPENEEDEDDETIKVVDTTDYTIKLTFEGQSYDIMVPHNDSILNAGLAQGLKLPYSCKSGMCSTCISSCTQGNVRMDYNEILTDKDIQKGRILLCTGHPTMEGTEIEVS